MKKTKSQKNKLSLQELSDLFMTRNIIVKNSKYYNRLYSTKPTSINISSSLNNNHTNNLLLSQNIKDNNNNNNKSKKANTNNIRPNTTKKRILSTKQKSLWPKVTKPKWPFTLKRNEPKELIHKRLLSANPSEKYHNYDTIRWLNQKYSDSVKQKSIFSLLPNKGKRIIPANESEKNKRHRKILEYLESFRAPKEREKNVEINPKYFYNKQTFEKIKKMKEMFLMFDREGKQKMVLKEMARLFKNNGIEVEIDEIKDLFFKDLKNTKSKNAPINLLYLDFYQFITFALSKDQDFRLFIRKIKQKKKNKYEKKGIYYPMNFNIALDYFMRKEKQRYSVTAVQNAINDMDKMMNIENEDIFEKNNMFNIDEINLSKKTNNTYALSSKKNNMKISKTFNYLEESNNFKDINFSELIQEFSNLFGINKSKKELDGFNMINKRGTKSAKMRNIIKIKGNNTFTEEMKAKLRNETLKNINIENFQKYKNLKLAIEATKEQIKYMKTHNNKNGLIEEDKKTVDMIDLKQIVNHDYNSAHIPKKIFNFRNRNFFQNIDNSLLINVYLDNRNKNRRKKLSEKYSKTKDYNNKKLMYNFYCGCPRIINDEYNKKLEYDFVPNELMVEEK